LLAPFAMYVPLARSDYYRASAPPATHSRQRTCPPPSWMDSGRATADGSHVHHTLDRPGRCPALLRQHRHGYAADLHRGLPTGTGNRLRSWPPPTGQGSRTAHRPISTRF